MKEMTGEEFLNMVRSIKEITNIQWEVEGDAWEPDEVLLVVVADGEKIRIPYPRATDDKDEIFMQSMFIGLMINKFHEQMDIDSTVNIGQDLSKAINNLRLRIQKGEI